jgi:hypothetical protein
LRGERVCNCRAGGWVHHIKIDNRPIVGHLRINTGNVDEHRHARPRQIRDLLIVRQIRASAHSRRTSTFAPSILHFDIHEQRIPQLDDPHNQQQQHRQYQRKLDHALRTRTLPAAKKRSHPHPHSLGGTSYKLVFMRTVAVAHADNYISFSSILWIRDNCCIIDSNYVHQLI